MEAKTINLLEASKYSDEQIQKAKFVVGSMGVGAGMLTGWILGRQVFPRGKKGKLLLGAAGGLLGKRAFLEIFKPNIDRFVACKIKFKRKELSELIHIKLENLIGKSLDKRLVLEELAKLSLEEIFYLYYVLDIAYKKVKSTEESVLTMLTLDRLSKNSPPYIFENLKTSQARTQSP